MERATGLVVVIGRGRGKAIYGIVDVIGGGELMFGGELVRYCSDFLFMSAPICNKSYGEIS